MRVVKNRNARVLLPVLCLLVLILLATAAVGTVVYLNRGHTAFALIRVSMSPESLVGRTQRVDINEYQVFKNTQLGLIKSPYVFMAALRKKDIANLEIVKQEDDPLDWLQRKLKVEYINNSEIMRVSLTADNPEETVKLVDAIVDTYIEEAVNKQERERRAMAAQLTQIFNSKENEVRTKRATLISLSEKLNAWNSESVKVQLAVGIQELSALRSGMLRMKTSLAEAKGSLQAGKAILERLGETPVSELELEKLVRQDPVYKQHAETIAALRKVVKQQKQMDLPNQKDKPDDKKVVAERLAKQLKSLEEELDTRKNELRELIKAHKRAEIEEEIAAAEVQVKILTEQLEQLSAQVDAQKKKITEIGKSSVDIEMMTSELETLEKALAEIAAKREMLNIESQARPRIIKESAASLVSR